MSRESEKVMIENPGQGKGGPRLLDLLILPLVPLAVIGGLGLIVMIAASQSRWDAGSALIVTGVSAVAGGLVVAWVWRRWPEFLPQAILAAMGIRMMLTLVGILVFALILGNRDVRFFLYTIVLYLAGLAGETIIAVSKLSVGNSHLSATRGKET